MFYFKTSFLPVTDVAVVDTKALPPSSLNRVPSQSLRHVVTHPFTHTVSQSVSGGASQMQSLTHSLTHPLTQSPP